jgi:hypothetical protein
MRVHAPAFAVHGVLAAVSGTTVGRVGAASIASAIRFLAGPASNFINGATLPVAGGTCAAFVAGGSLASPKVTQQERTAQSPRAHQIQFLPRGVFA